MENWKHVITTASVLSPARDGETFQVFKEHSNIIVGAALTQRIGLGAAVAPYVVPLAMVLHVFKEIEEN